MMNGYNSLTSVEFQEMVLMSVYVGMRAGEKRRESWILQDDNVKTQQQTVVDTEIGGITRFTSSLNIN